jgi:uncharacterized protein YdeI (YjbR/CyaY-like superfamily)
VSDGCIAILTTRSPNIDRYNGDGRLPSCIAIRSDVKPIFFQTVSAFRKWLEQYHAKVDAIWVGYYRKHLGKKSITWSESVDEALCYGWIDGVRQRIDASSYRIRFTPRKPGSIWSSVNIKRAQALIEQGRMQPAGLKAYEVRQENRIGIYSYEQRSVDLPKLYDSLLKKNKIAWNFYRMQSASYRKAVNWWVISAKREETRLKRLEKLIANSVKAQRVPEFTVGKLPLRNPR